MSISEDDHFAVDWLCPHGTEPQHGALDTIYTYDEEDDVGIILDPNNVNAYVSADADAFVEVGPR